MGCCVVDRGQVPFAIRRGAQYSDRGIFNYALFCYFCRSITVISVLAFESSATCIDFPNDDGSVGHRAT